MATSMVSTVLEIEREAEALLTNAGQEVNKLIADAKSQREAASRVNEDAVKKEIADLEAAAAADRGKKVKELTVTGEAALAAVKNISDAAFDKGVQYILKALAEK